MHVRVFDPLRDSEAAHRIWREVGWLEKDKEEAMDLIVAAGRALVADLDGSAECLVISAPGTVRYLCDDLPLSIVTGVTTSLVARKQHLARRVAAQVIAADVADGALIAGLGMFEQGFYNQLGFGTGGYEHWLSFDPAQLTVAASPRVPVRLSTDDWERIHSLRLQRLRGHGAVNLFSANLTRGEMLLSSKSAGFGYCDGPDGSLSHYVWCGIDDAGHGPYWVKWMVYQTFDQFLELMALLKSFGDQVRLIRMIEPAGIQLQDLLRQPFRNRDLTAKARFEQGMRASAYWQVRICDLPSCLAHTHLWGPEVRFNLALSDPIEAVLPDDAPWRGVAGEYVVTLGPSSGAERGRDASLPTLAASVNAFTRMWIGVRPATGLAVTDDLRGTQELLEQLSDLLRLPDPKPDWDF